MSRETYIWIAFCVFAFLVGMRLKKYFGSKKEEAEPQVKKNQRSKAAKTEGAGQVPLPGRRDRSKTLRVYTILMMVVVFLLILGMIPTLLRDVQRESGVDPTNLFLRLLIFLMACLVFVLSYIKLARQRKKESGGKGGNIKK